MAAPYCFFVEGIALNYFKHLVKAFAPDMLDIYIGPNDRVVELSAYAPSHQTIFTELRDAGYRLMKIDPQKIHSYKGALLEYRFFANHNRLFQWPLTPYVRTATLLHATDDLFNTPYDLYAAFIVLASERQASRPYKDKFFRPRHGSQVDELLQKPDYMLNQFTYSGPYQLGDWLRFRNAPEQLRGEIEKTLGCRLDPDKPIVAFFDDENCDQVQFTESLKQLAPHVNLIVKNMFHWDVKSIEHAHIWPDLAFASNLLRFGADYILAGYWSGTLSTAAMIGLRVIPYYTNKVYLNSLRRPEDEKPYTYFMPIPNEIYYNSVCADIMRYLASPLNLGDTGAILDRIHDAKYWRDYWQKWPRARQKIFGNYQLEDAAQITAALLIRGFETGKLGEYCSAVHLRSSYADIPAN